MSNNTVSRNKLLEYKIKSAEFKNEFEKLTTRRPAVPENIVQEMYTMGKSALERIYTKLNETDKSKADNFDRTNEDSITYYYNNTIGAERTSSVPPSAQSTPSPTPSLTSKVKANLNAEAIFTDLITLEETKYSIEEYINEDKNNIAIVYQKIIEGERVDKYFLTKRDTINKQYDNNESTVYPCRNTSTAFIPHYENIIDKPYFDLHKLGFIEANQQYCDMKQYDSNKSVQLFAIIDLKKKYDTFVSHQVRSQGYVADVVSDLHCQEGQQGSICKLIVATPSTKDNPEALVYGKKQKRTKKTNKPKNKSKNKRKKSKKIKKRKS